ncbi:MAG: hypothetical protein ACI9XK_002218 [Granulosicoccus sp.]|jgi:hypothetical protein
MTAVFRMACTKLLQGELQVVMHGQDVKAVFVVRASVYFPDLVTEL